MRHSTFLVGTALAALVAAPAAAQDTLRAQTTLPVQHALSQSFIKHFVEVVNERGEGVVQINLLGGPEINPQDRAPQALERGVIDVLWIPAAFMVGQVPESQAMMLQNIGIDELRENGAFEHFQDIFRERLNAHFLAWSETGGGYYIYTTREPRMDEDGVVDLTGFNMRSTGAYRPILEELNATPTQIDAGEVPNALDRGVVDGFGWPTVGLETQGLQNNINYRIEPSYYHLANVVLVNMNSWERLSEEARELLEELALEYEQASIREMEEQGEADIAAADAAGVQAIRMEGEAADIYLSRAFEAMWGNVENNVGAETAEELRGYLYRSPN